MALYFSKSIFCSILTLARPLGVAVLLDDVLKDLLKVGFGISRNGFDFHSPVNKDFFRSSNVWLWHKGYFFFGKKYVETRYYIPDCDPWHLLMFITKVHIFQ